MKLNFKKQFLAALAAVGAIIVSSCSNAAPPGAEQGAAPGATSQLGGQVLVAGKPVADATVTLYAAGEGAPTQVAQSKTGGDGKFSVEAKSAPKDGVLYLIAKGPNDAIALMSVLGTSLPKTVTINELTTVASAFTAARFINGEAISGNPLGLRIAAGNTPNLVDPATGGWGKVLLDPLNSSMTTTLANLDTLGSLITAFVHGGQRRLACPLLQGRNADRRSDAQEHARSDGRHRPRAVGRTQGTLCVVRRSLSAAEGRFAAQCALRAVSRLRPGRLRSLAVLLGRRGLCQWPVHVRCGRQPLERQNWMPGSQSGVNKSIGGGVGKFSSQRDSALAADHWLHRHGH